LALLLAFGLFAAACGDDSSDDADAGDDSSQDDIDGDTGSDDGDADDTGSDDPAAGDGDTPVAADCDGTEAGTEVAYGRYAPNRSLDPTVSSGSLIGGTEIANVYDVLIRFDEETATYEPWVAESLEPNEDYTEWTLTIPEGITYGNGDAFVAQDVVDSIARFSDGAAAGVRNSSTGFVPDIDLENTTVPDDQTVVFALTTSWATFPFVLSDEPGMIVNPRVVAELVESEGDVAAAREKLGTTPELINAASFGPYEVSAFEVNGDTTLTARQDYWGGAPCIETLEFTFIPGSRATYEAYQAGDLDIGFLRTADVIADARDNGEVEEMSLQNLGSVLLMNHSKVAEGADLPPTADPRLREAITLAVDPSVVNERAYGGTGLMGKGAVQETSDLWTEALGDATPGVDLDRARELVEQVKADGWDGTLTFVHAEEPPIPDTALAIVGMLGAVGIEAQTATGPTQPFLIDRVILNSDYDIALWAHNASASTYITSMEGAWRSTSRGNYMGYVSEAMDAALADLKAAPTQEDQQQALVAIQEILATDFPALILGGVEEGIVHGPDITGIVETSATIHLFADASVAG
jgi:peptide/nickel transport system substrate-binding protein